MSINSYNVTTHEMAKKLLEMPDMLLKIEGWVEMPWNHEMTVSPTEYDPDGTAIIWQKPL